MRERDRWEKISCRFGKDWILAGSLFLVLQLRIRFPLDHFLVIELIKHRPNTQDDHNGSEDEVGYRYVGSQHPEYHWGNEDPDPNQNLKHHPGIKQTFHSQTPPSSVVASLSRQAFLPFLDLSESAKSCLSSRAACRHFSEERACLTLMWKLQSGKTTGFYVD
jgi:hypothetical protein